MLPSGSDELTKQAPVKASENPPCVSSNCSRRLVRSAASIPDAKQANEQTGERTRSVNRFSRRIPISRLQLMTYLRQQVKEALVPVGF